MTLFCHKIMLSLCCMKNKGETMMRSYKIFIFILTMLLSLMLSACGGGGGTGGGEENATSNQWNQMSWDQGKWG